MNIDTPDIRLRDFSPRASRSRSLKVVVVVVLLVVVVLETLYKNVSKTRNLGLRTLVAHLSLNSNFFRKKRT